MSEAPGGPLAGFRVLDFTQVMAGPHCTRLLADAGAEVIKIEPPEGDPMRARPPVRDGHSAYYGQLNCGKKSLAVDLRSNEGRAVARALAARADVVVENFRPGVMARLGLDYGALADANPALVYCAISGFGQTGPAAGRPAYAPMLNAASGHDLAHMGYQDGADRPPNAGIFAPDVLGGTYAFGAIQAALIHRLRTGRGQFIDVSLMESAITLLVHQLQEAQFPDRRPRPAYGPVRTRDGFVIVPIFTEKNFRALARAIGRPDIVADSRFATVAARERHWKALMALVEEWTVSRTAAECEELLLGEGCPCSAYRSIAEALSDPQLAHRGFLVEVADGAGRFRAANAPYRFSDSPVGIGTRVAALGEHTAEVLEGVLGWDRERIAALARAGVLGAKS